MTECDAQTWDLALRLLSRREYAVLELRRKLMAKGLCDEKVGAVLGRLQEQGLQSDERYATMLLRETARRRQGPEKLRQTLRQQGIGDALVRQLLMHPEVDWFELAREARNKRFGQEPPQASDIKEKARQARFLASRGFNHEQVAYALASSGEENDGV